jgi:hypothetical protein
MSSFNEFVLGRTIYETFFPQNRQDSARIVNGAINHFLKSGIAKGNLGLFLNFTLVTRLTHLVEGIIYEEEERPIKSRIIEKQRKINDWSSSHFLLTI